MGIIQALKFIKSFFPQCIAAMVLERS